MTPEQQNEALAVQIQMQAYLNTLATSGVSEQIIAAAVGGAMSERALRIVGPTKAAAWFRGMALNIDKLGPAALAAIKAN